MRRLPGISTELANAVRQVNAAFNRLPAAVQDGIEIAYGGLNRSSNAAIDSGDDSRALAAIRASPGHWLGHFRSPDHEKSRSSRARREAGT